MSDKIQFTRRVVALSLGLSALAITATYAQQMPEKIEEAVTISFANYNLASAGIGRDATQEMLDAFAEANPNIKVAAMPVPPDDMIGRVQAEAVAGKAPDVAQIVFGDLDYAAANLGAKALEDIVPADELEAHFSGMFPNGLELGRLNGKTYGLPYVFSTPVLFYNADMFKTAGLDPDAPPATWDEVKEAAVAINKVTGKTGLIVGIFGQARDWLFQSVVLSSGGRVLSEDRKTLTFAEPEAIAAVQMLRDIAETGTMQAPPSTGAGIEIMSSGNAGMFLNTSSGQAALLRGSEGKYELRSAAMPSFPGKAARPTNSGSALIIMTDDPVKQRAAWELMKHLTSDYAYTIITSKIGYVPLRPNAIESEDYLAPWIRENPISLPNLEQLKRLEPRVPMPGPNYRQITTTLMNAAEEATFGKGDVAEIMTAAQTRAQALMPR